MAYSLSSSSFPSFSLLSSSSPDSPEQSLPGGSGDALLSDTPGFTFGLDEAGLGPVLGPLCHGFCSFAHPHPGNDSAEKEFFRTRGIIPTDSKSLPPNRRNRLLEETVFSFLLLLKRKIPGTLSELLTVLKIPRPRQELLQKTVPWFREAPLPLFGADSPEELESRLRPRVCLPGRSREEEIFRPVQFEASLCNAGRLNGLFRSGLNKAEAARTCLTPFLRKAVFSALPAPFSPPVSPETRQIFVDRQGGRRRYAALLQEDFPEEEIRILRETPRVSSYRIGRATLHFIVRSESLRPECALASMIAKYLREVSMACFNRYWQSRYPALKGTAGYPVDAARFLRELQNRCPLSPEDKELLIRRR